MAMKKQRFERRRAKPNFDRDTSSGVRRLVKKSFLIVCEGENTEPSYFNKFKLSTATVKAIGEGYNTLSLVNRTTEIVEEETAKGRVYDYVWCVFDRDSFSAKEFNDAIRQAEANDYSVAYSNQAFEYWFILHFEDHQGGGLNRKEYDNKINGYLKPLKCEYEGKQSKLVTDDFFQIMLEIDSKTQKSRQDLAIARAKRVLKFHEDEGTSPERAESSTAVFRLVEEMKKYI
jgi:hypothetical protein